MSDIVIFGAGGRAGTAAAAEAAGRGHHVTASRRADADVTDLQAITAAARGHDAAIVAVAPADRDPVEFYRSAANGLAAGLLDAGVRRLVWVSLAALLPDASGVALADSDTFPAEYRPFSLGHRAALERLTRSDLIWTAVSPAGDFDRNSAPRGDYSLTNVGDLRARITHADHARAIIDLAERPHERVGEHVGVLRRATG